MGLQTDRPLPAQAPRVCLLLAPGLAGAVNLSTAACRPWNTVCWWRCPRGIASSLPCVRGSLSAASGVLWGGCGAAGGLSRCRLPCFPSFPPGGRRRAFLWRWGSGAPSMEEQCEEDGEPSEKPPWAQGSSSGPSGVREVQRGHILSDLTPGKRRAEETPLAAARGEGTLGWPPSRSGCLSLSARLPPACEATERPGPRVPRALGLVMTQKGERRQKADRWLPGSRLRWGSRQVFAFRVWAWSRREGGPHWARGGCSV